MTREESADALKMMLQDVPSPAQVGAFMIAHRIRRPEPQELAGMIDTYLKLGPRLISGKQQKKPICFGMPFDGRTRTAPIYPLTALVLITAGQPVILQGGKRMPVKYGVTTQELLHGLGLPSIGLNIDKVQCGFFKNNFAFIHQPTHFPEADKLLPFREDIGKRPPVASMELLWTAHKGIHKLITGYVHIPTEARHITTLKLLGEKDFITMKGLEGGTDFSINNSTKTRIIENMKDTNILFNPKEYSLKSKDIDFKDVNEWQVQSIQALQGKGCLAKTLIWNAGIYLWLAKVSKSLPEGLSQAEKYVKSGEAIEKLFTLRRWHTDQFN